MLGPPVHFSRYGNAREVTKLPRLPAMFMVPETAPAFLPAISMQKDHEGGRVMSAPKIATASHATAPPGVSMQTLASNPVAASVKPAIAGIRRDRFQWPAR